MTEMTDEEWRKLAERRKKIRNKNGQIFAGLSAYMDKCCMETLELIRRRHAYYTELISAAEIKAAQDFYDRFKDQFLMYGVELKLSDNKEWCSIYLELGDNCYENYWVGDGKDDGFAEVSTEVSFKEMFNNVEVNIITGEKL